MGRSSGAGERKRDDLCCWRSGYFRIDRSVMGGKCDSNYSCTILGLILLCFCLRAYMIGRRLSEVHFADGYSSRLKAEHWVGRYSSPADADTQTLLGRKSRDDVRLRCHLVRSCAATSGSRRLLWETTSNYPASRDSIMEQSLYGCGFIGTHCRLSAFIGSVFFRFLPHLTPQMPNYGGKTSRQ